MSALPPHTSTRRRGARLATHGLAATALAASVLAISAGSASADSDGGATVANAEVTSGITLTDLVPAFTLAGTPGQTVSTVTPVTYNVETNNLTGYTVTVQSATSTMVATDPDNADFIPIGDLTVREAGSGTYTPLTATEGVLVHAQAGRSANGGDSLGTDFQMRMPTVNADTYSATLNYLASTPL